MALALIFLTRLDFDSFKTRSNNDNHILKKDSFEIKCVVNKIAKNVFAVESDLKGRFDSLLIRVLSSSENNSFDFLL